MEQKTELLIQENQKLALYLEKYQKDCEYWKQ